MTVTVAEQIAKALKLAGLLASGEDAPPTMAEDCLDSFNDFLNALQTQRLTIYAQERSVYSLVSGTATYTIGSGATFNQARPLWIDAVGLINGDYETPLGQPVSVGEWSRVADKGTQGFPVATFYNPEYANGELTFYPVPSDSDLDVAIYWPSASLTSVTSLNTSLSLPPGWGKMLTYNLAREFATLFGQPVRPEVADIARQTIADIKRLNVSHDVLTFDPALRSRRPYVTGSRFDGGDF